MLSDPVAEAFGLIHRHPRVKISAVCVFFYSCIQEYELGKLANVFSPLRKNLSGALPENQFVNQNLMFEFQSRSPVTVYHFVAFRYSSAKYSISGSFKIVYGYIKVPLELMEIITFFQGSLTMKWSGGDGWKY